MYLFLLFCSWFLFLKFMRNFAFLKHNQLEQGREPNPARTWIFQESLKDAFYNSLPSQVLHLFKYEWSTIRNHYFLLFLNFTKLDRANFVYETVHLNPICIVQPEEREQNSKTVKVLCPMPTADLRWRRYYKKYRHFVFANSIYRRCFKKRRVY